MQEQIPEQNDDGTITVKTNLKSIGCRRHLAPFTEFWPNGLTIWSLKLRERILKMDEMFILTGGDAKKIPFILEQTPACCFVDSHFLRSLYIEIAEMKTIEFGRYGRCYYCKKKELGANCRTSLKDDSEVNHICFDCIVGRRQ